MRRLQRMGDDIAADELERLGELASDLDQAFATLGEGAATAAR